MKQLEILAKKKKIPASQAATEIMEQYFDYQAITKLDMVRDTKNTISNCFDMINDDNLQKLTEMDALEVIRSFKTMTNDHSFEKISSLMRSWFEFSNYKLEEFDEGNYTKFVCHNTMSKNWNIHQANVFVKIYSTFGYDGISETNEKNLFIIKILKK